MSTPPKDKFAAMFEKMIDDFCETHSSGEIEAMFAKCDELFGGIEKRQRSVEGVAAPLEPTPQIDDAFVEQIEDALGMGHGAWDMVDPVEICKAVAAAVSKNLQEELTRIKASRNRAGDVLMEISMILPDSGMKGFHPIPLEVKKLRDRAETAETRILELEKEITALREKP